MLLYGQVRIFIHPIRETIWTFFAKSNRRLEFLQHIVHLAVMYLASATKNLKYIRTHRAYIYIYNVYSSLYIGLYRIEYNDTPHTLLFYGSWQLFLLLCSYVYALQPFCLLKIWLLVFWSLAILSSEVLLCWFILHCRMLLVRCSSFSVFVFIFIRFEIANCCLGFRFRIFLHFPSHYYSLFPVFLQFLNSLFDFHFCFSVWKWQFTKTFLEMQSSQWPKSWNSYEADGS